MLSHLLHFIKNVLITNFTTIKHKCFDHVEKENKDEYKGEVGTYSGKLMK